MSEALWDSRIELPRSPPHRDRPASGSFWIEPGTGRIVITVLRTGDRVFDMESTVFYRNSADLAMLVPFEMRELYRQWLEATKRKAERITRKATYEHFRGFQVTTDERIRVPR
jgi:hypothetical protein